MHSTCGSFPEAVVWNIGKERAGGLKDLGAGEWEKYVCYEAATIAKPVKVAKGASWTGGQTFSKVPLSALPKPKAKAID